MALAKGIYAIVKRQFVPLYFHEDSYTYVGSHLHISQRHVLYWQDGMCSIH